MNRLPTAIQGVLYVLECVVTPQHAFNRDAIPADTAHRLATVSASGTAIGTGAVKPQSLT